VQVGDLVTLDRQVTYLKNNLAAGKAFDDRAAVVCIAKALQDLATMKHAWDVYAIANVQEEVGLRGAMTSTYQVNPDVAIAIDVGHADQPNTNDADIIPLHSGAAIALGPNIHPAIHDKLTEVASANEIPFKIDVEPGATGTDAWAMQIVREGIPTGLISIPLRYMHTSVETVSLTDLERIARLLALFCSSLDDSFIAKMRGEPETTEEKPAKKKRATTRRNRRK